MEHTPGPWEYLTPHAVGGAEIVPVTGGPCIHTFWNENPDLRDDQEHEANARLIASAPDLLEIVLELREYDRDRDLWGINDKIDAAIAKATNDA